MPASSIEAAIDVDALDAVVARLVPDAGDRSFVVRCICQEGPVHHRGASYALIRLLALALQAAGGALAQGVAQGVAQGLDRPAVSVPMRLPPHLQQHADGEHDFPLAMPLAPLGRLAPEGSRDLDALVECLVDGPPHHALANAVMVSLVGALLDRLEHQPTPV